MSQTQRKTRGTLISSWMARQDFVLLRPAMRSLLNVEGVRKSCSPLAFSAPRCTEEVHTSCRSRCKRDRSSLHCTWELRRVRIKKAWDTRSQGMTNSHLWSIQGRLWYGQATHRHSSRPYQNPSVFTSLYSTTAIHQPLSIALCSFESTRFSANGFPQTTSKI